MRDSFYNRGKRFKSIFGVLLGVLLLGSVLNGVFLRKKIPMDKPITEVILTTFRYPHPYLLQFVAEYRFAYQIGEYLVRFDDHQNIVPGLASSWLISADRHSITFTIRHELYSATEVAQSLHRILKQGQTTHSNFSEQVSKIEVIDEGHLKLETRGDAAAVLNPLVMADSMIVPDAHWIAVPGHAELQVDWKSTHGPYIWQSGELPLAYGQEVVFVPNPKHYLFSKEQSAWRIRYEDPAKYNSHGDLKNLLERFSPAFCTLRHSIYTKIAATKEDGISFFETRHNGVGFFQLNTNSDRFRSREARRAFARRVLSSPISLPDNVTKAFQIPQPGLVGRVPSEEEEKIRQAFLAAPDVGLNGEIRIPITLSADVNVDWETKYAQSLGLSVQTEKQSIFPHSPEWKSGKYDLIFLSLGMSDEDPISGASFMFSHEGMKADFEDGRIMKSLNAAKSSKDGEVISLAVRAAFRTALEEAFVVPLFYTRNRHYYSGNLQLNISDPYSESVQIWKVRTGH